MAISEETFFLDARFQGTLQNQIQQMIAEGILSGRFLPGEKLPSTRKLAHHLGVSRITVTLAYTELLANDYLMSRGRSGYYISDGAPQPTSLVPAPRLPGSVDWDNALVTRVSATRVAKPADWRAYRYPFVYGQADPALFDQKSWRLCALQSLGSREFDSLTADHADRDDPLLVEFILRHILPRRGITAAPEDVLITLGAQNGLWIAAHLLLDDSRRAAIEYPFYPSLHDILEQTGAQVQRIPVDRDGLPPEDLSSKTDLVFVTPSHQCPTNVTMPLARRQALLARASADDMLIVEDDYEFELAFLNPPSPALKSLDRDGRVLYVGSFSKSLCPGLRLGFLVGPAPFIAQARALRAALLRHPPGQIQRTTAHFLRLGHYDAQIRRMSRALRERRETLDAAIAAEGLRVSGAGVFGGSSLWMTLPEGRDATELATSLQDDGVLIEPGGPFFGHRGPTPHYRLAYSSIPSGRIAEGVAIIARHAARLG